MKQQYEHILPAKGHPKNLNAATFGISISWPKIMFECFPSGEEYALRPPLLIYVSKHRICIS